MSDSIQETISGILCNAQRPLSLRALHRRMESLPNRQPPAWPQVFHLAAAHQVELVDWINRLLKANPHAVDDILAKSRPGAGSAHCRLAIVARDSSEFLRKLEQCRPQIAQPDCVKLRIPNGIYYSAGEMSPVKLALLFPGQGSQFPRMLASLCLASSRACEWFHLLDEAYEEAGLTPATELIYAPPASPGGDKLFSLEKGAQLSLAASLALHEVIAAMGVQPSAMVGHSNGEHAALIAAGAYVFPDRKSTCENLCRGGLLLRQLALPTEAESVVAINGANRKGLDKLLGRFPSELFVAMDNAPSQIVLAGASAAMSEAMRWASEARAIAIPLAFDRAWHTPLFQSGAAILRDYYKSLPMAPPRVPVYSCMDGRPFSTDRAEIIEQTCRQWVSPVYFRQTIRRLYEEGVRIFVEVGPGSTLTGLVDDSLRGLSHLAVSASSQTRDDVLQLQHLAAQLFTWRAIGPVDLLDLLADAAPAAAPAAPPSSIHSANSAAQFVTESHRRFLEEVSASQQRVQDRFSGLASPTPFLAPKVMRQGNSLRASCHLDVEQFPILADHSFGRLSARHANQTTRRPLAVVPFTVSLELLAEAAGRLLPGRLRTISDIQAHHWLALDGGSLDVDIAVEQLPGANDEDLAHARIFQLVDGQPRLAFEGVAHFGPSCLPPAKSRIERNIGSRGPRWAVVDFYRQFAFHGPMFQGLDRVIRVSEDSIQANAVVTRFTGPDHRDLKLDPALLDCAGQLVAFWLLEHGESDFGIFPFHAQSVSLFRQPPSPGMQVRCQGTIQFLAGESTVASFEFSDPENNLIAKVEGLRQKLIRFPMGLSAALTRSPETVFLSKICEPLGAAAMDLEEWALLYAHGGIWARVLAHLTLHEREFQEWNRLAGSSRRVPWLLERLVAKDAYRRWAEERGQTIPPAQLRIEPCGEGTVRASSRVGPALTLVGKEKSILAYPEPFHPAISTEGRTPDCRAEQIP